MYEWDERKNQRNIEKHGISFELASRIFEGPVLSAPDTRNEYGEVREISIGKVEGILMLVVVHTQRSGKTRIISARRANAKERTRYDEEIR